MKTLLTRILLPVALYTAYLLATHAADTTNVIVKVTAERILSGVTNAASSTLNIIPTSGAKDAARANGLAHLYAIARTDTNMVDSFDNWLAKTWIKNLTTEAGNQYNRSIRAATAAKLTEGLATGAYSEADVATLTTISNKAPVP